LLQNNVKVLTFLKGEIVRPHQKYSAKTLSNCYALKVLYEALMMISRSRNM